MKLDSGSFTRPSDWIYHSGVSNALVKECFREGQPPSGHVVIRFVEPDLGSCLVNENTLMLKDRGLTVGDVVKKNSSDAQSGIISKVSTMCLLQPIYTDLPYHGSDRWDHQPEDNMVMVPSQDLKLLDYEPGDRIIYNDWMGEIVDIYEQVCVRLSNGSVVQVQEPDSLEVPSLNNKSSTQNVNLVEILKMARTRRNGIKALDTQGDNTMPVSTFHPGQTVLTTKMNLRLGRWVIGSYSPNIPARGTVVDVLVTSIRVDWIATKLYDSSRQNLDAPSEILEFPELDKIKLYNGAEVTECSPDSQSLCLGSRQAHDISAGEIVKFRDVAGAAVKYSGQAPNGAGVFRRIPREMTDGFDMNTFRVRETSTKALVQWQDGRLTVENSNDVRPYLQIDDHDLWIGEIVSLRSAEEKKDGLIHLKEVGVVQSVDANERIARLRWFEHPLIAIFEEKKNILFSGASLGPMSDRETLVPLFDVLAYPALTKRRGDLVVIAPNSEALAVQSAGALIRASGDATIPPLPDLRGADLTPDPQNILSSSEVRWFGEVVDLGLDGLLRIRLGALDKPQDIKVPIQQVTVAVGGDDDDDSESDGTTDSEDSSRYDDMSSDRESLVPISQSFEYEGGQRLDNGAEEDWMTDDSEPDSPGTLNGSCSIDSEDEDGDIEMSDAPRSSPRLEPTKLPVENGTSTDLTPSPQPQSGSSAKEVLGAEVQYQFSKYNDMPPQFEMLESDSYETHHFADKTPSLSASLLRRIRKEHRIFEDNLPEGIWIRTWDERLDLLRVLILGPRGTPYELAPFMLDFRLENDFPNSPPQVFFHSWTHGVGRVNPNLYEDGKVCLSILGTWDPNYENEGWNSSKSSLLQVIVSLLGLVLVVEPYYSKHLLSFRLPRFLGIRYLEYWSIPRHATACA